jgi:cyanophycinase
MLSNKRIAARLASLVLSVVSVASVAFAALPGAAASEPVLGAGIQPAAGQNAGSLVIIGGALRPDNADVWQKIVQLAGGKGAKIAVFPSASAKPEKSGQALVEILQRYGAEPFMVPLAVKLAEPDYRQVARDPAWVKRVAEAGGVYFAGGDQGRITQALNTPDGKPTPLLDAVWQVYRKGGVIGGSSAGAAIMSSTMFYDAMPVLPTLKLGVEEGKQIAPGLGFIGDKVFVDQHLIIRGRFARMLPVMLKKHYQLGLGIDENTAMVVGPGGEVEIVGYKGAILLDLSQASGTQGENGLQLSNARISYLDRGDRFNLNSKVVTPAPDKQPLDPAKPYNTAPRLATDILANSAVLDLLSDLIDSSQNEMLGLAFGPDDSVKPQIGYEFRFSKVAGSKGYYSGANGGEAYTVLGVRLDVVPVQMALPLYRK